MQLENIQNETQKKTEKKIRVSVGSGKISSDPIYVYIWSP